MTQSSILLPEVKYREYESQLAEKDAALTENAVVIVEKDAVIADLERHLAEEKAKAR